MFSTCYSNDCVKSVHIRSYSGPHFPAFGLNTERYFVSLRIQYSVRMRENAEQNNSEYGHFSRCEYHAERNDRKISSRLPLW